MYKIYPFVDTKKIDASGESPVFLIVKKVGGWRFWLSTGLSSRGKLDGLSFPRGTQNARVRGMSLLRMMSDAEAVMQRKDVQDETMLRVKELLNEEVFGVERKDNHYLGGVIADFAETKTGGTRTLYLITSKRVTEFDAAADIHRIDAAWLERFRQWCIGRGMKVNGAGQHLRNIRATCNWARRKRLTNNYPFFDFHIVEEETFPNNLSADELRRLRDYPCEPWQEKYVDFFMLSFYLAGINPGDLLLCKADAVKDNHLQFIRRKTNKQGAHKIRTVVIPVVDEAWAIIKKYPSEEGYLLGFMDGRKDYHSFLKKCNEALKKIGTSEKVPDKVGKLRKVEYHPLFPDITLYTARYSFGSIAANDLDISEQTIGMCLGHSWSKNVTARYIAHDQRKVDMAVRRVVDYVSKE